MLVAENGKIILAPPIAKWTIGKDPDKVMDYYERKEATILCNSKGLHR